MITFANIELLLLLLFLIPYGIWYFLFSQKREVAMRYPDTYPFHFIKKSLRIRLIHIPFILRCIAWTLLVLILARPQSTTSWTKSDVEGIDIVFAVDISTSMLAEDLHPNRIEAAKDVAIEFISARPNDNIGLTVFAGEAFTQCPMTTDHKVLLNLFQQIGCEMPQRGLIDDGTAIGMGIASAVARLKESKAKSKIIILETDGFNNKGEISPLTAAEIAKKHGIRIYTIGVGTNGTAKYPIPLPGGGVHYSQMPVEIDVATLKQIATLTNGKFFRAGNNDEFKEIYKDIDKLEKTKMTVDSFSQKYEVYQPFGLAALLVLLAEFLLRTIWLRRFT